MKFKKPKTSLDKDNNQAIVGKGQKNKRWIPLSALSALGLSNKRILAGILILLVTYVGWRHLATNQLYLTVGNHAITNQQFEYARQDYTSYHQSTVDPLTEPEASFIERQMVLEIALGDEAVKHGLEVNQSDITKKLADDFDSYPPEYFTDVSTESSEKDKADAIIQFLIDSYSWQQEAVDRHYRITMLQERLENELLGLKTVLQVTSAWNLSGATGNKTTDQKIARQSLEKHAVGLLKSDVAAEEILYEIGKRNFKLETTKAPNYIRARVLNSRAGDLDPANFSEDELQLINQLDEPGSTTPIGRSDSGYDYIYRLESNSDGRYTTWQNYLDEAYQLSHKFNSVFDWRRLNPFINDGELF